MESWRRFLRHLAPRPDAQQPFYPERVEPVGPALLPTMDLLSAAYVGGRLIEALALRGGTRVRAGAAGALLKRLSRALPEEVVNHCEAEAERALAWLHEAETLPEPPSPRHPELDLMLSSDVKSRLEVAQRALEEGQGLELERYDAEQHLWFRHRATPLELIDASAGDMQSALRLRDERGDVLEIPLKAIRWLMPVAPPQKAGDQAKHGQNGPNGPNGRKSSEKAKEGGELLSFPFGRSKDRPTLLDDLESEVESDPPNSPDDPS
ncbi:hypothetical protein FRC98_18050 [Lujinxingia vulgaris]|uniref:Uncharacterized protein n=1 Tax=Lujinxingia vulgaris TaxID=2600176 RepID=A0A5C6X6P4_9DELT|nr:hypothetical protein [Lujinxingia vulgaris]TXD34735.1 hypothetical protein FRC98_18050 [Lujinxingia vulgaris]